ncbi:hypothetical protein [Thermocatellispora tengchongensis]|uniref:hypothetical protein n=1 Tax=Thermocatellispora tengchongensis TaxID=1073253 RepID=UPI003632E5EE
MRPRSRTFITIVLLSLISVFAAAPAQASQSAPFPGSFPLPAGFQPEGIAIGPGPYAYFGSRATGAVYRADLRTGAGRIVNPGPGTPRWA